MQNRKNMLKNLILFIIKKSLISHLMAISFPGWLRILAEARMLHLAESTARWLGRLQPSDVTRRQSEEAEPSWAGGKETLENNVFYIYIKKFFLIKKNVFFIGNKK